MPVKPGPVSLCAEVMGFIYVQTYLYDVQYCFTNITKSVVRNLSTDSHKWTHENHKSHI